MKKRVLSCFIIINILLLLISSTIQVSASGWILASELPAGTIVTGRKWTYDLTSYTTSSSSSLSGWTKYDTTWVWGPWGSWSSWKDDKITETESKDVETRKVTEKYNYYRYATSKTASSGSYQQSTSYPNKYKHSFDVKLTNSSTTGNGKGYKWYYENSNPNKVSGNYRTIWKDDPFETKKTQYRSRTRSKIYTYYYKKTERKESTSYPSGSNISNVQEYVTYDYKTFYLDLNGLLDNAYSDGIANFGTADVYINGALVVNDVTDYYSSHIYGTAYNITDIKAVNGHTYEGVSSGNLSGTLTSDVSVIVNFHTNSYNVGVVSEDETKGTTSGNGTYLYGEWAEVKATPKPGYSFNCWNDGDTNPQKNVCVTSSLAYTAYFKPNTYCITFDASGGVSDATLNKLVVFNDIYGDLPTPTREKHRFDGWYTASAGGEKIVSSSKVTTPINHTLYAQWSETEHTYTDWIVDIKETCTTIGKQHRDCIDCGYIEQIDVPAMGHLYSEEWSIIKEPTCVAEGEKAHKCCNCESTKGNLPIEKLNHNYGEWNTTKNPTCEQTGEKQRVCSNCNNIDSMSITALGHKFSEDWVITKEPTCTNVGEKAHICEMCGIETDNTEVSKVSHTYTNWETFIEADCTESGFDISSCDVCGKMGTRRVKSRGHQYSDEWTVTKQPNCILTGEKVNICEICGEESETTIMERTSHSYSTWDIKTEASCTESGTQTRKCNICGKSETLTLGALGHSYIVESIKQEPTDVSPGIRYMVCENGCGKTFAEYFYPEIEEGNIIISQEGEINENQVTLSVSLSDNPGFSRFTMKMNYDQDIFVPVSISPGELLDAGQFDSSLSGIEAGVVDPEELNTLLVKYGKTVVDKDITEDNLQLFEITFKLKSDIPKGEYKISTTYKGVSGYTSSDGITPSLGIYDSKGNQIMPQVSEAVLNVEVTNLKGDVNQDHKVDILDCGYLGYKLTGWIGLPWTNLHQQAADVFTDGRITPKDGTRLAQIISGYDLSPQVATLQSEEPEISLFASNQTTISVENVTAAANTEVDIPIVISNNKGLSGFDFKLNYDKNYLTPIAIIDGGLYNGSCITNLQQENLDTSQLDSVNVSWMSNGNIYGDGILFMVKFLVSKDVTDGQIIPLTLSCYDGAVCRVRDDFEIEDVEISVNQGVIETYIDTDLLSKNPIEISDTLMFTDENEEIKEIPQNGGFNLRINLIQHKAYSNSSTMIVATYNDSNALVSLESLDLTSEMLDQGFSDIYISQTEHSISSLKVFIWKSLNNMTPLTDCYNLKQ